MNRRWRGAATWTTLFLLLTTAAAPRAVAQDATAREITESERRLEQIRRERAQLREEMTRIRSQVSDLSNEVANLGRQAGTAAELLGELEFQVARRSEQIESTTRDLELARDQLAERRGTLSRRLRDIYKRGPLEPLEVLLTADSFSDLLNRYRYLFVLARHDRRLAERVTSLEAQLATRERALRSNLTQLESVRLERSSEHERLTSIQGLQRQALTSVRARERTTGERIEQLARDEARLGELLALLERRRREAEAAAAALVGASAAAAEVATLGPARMGSLAWPVEGPILYRFGRATQPNGTIVRWNGLGIGAPTGAAVRAVEGGSVVLASPFEGYGPTVVLSHGGGYYTLYLYLREIGVRVGDRVARGEVLGTVGGENSSQGPRVEFQIRGPGGQAVDPMAWLERR